jgi:hypothetical protein
MTTAEKQTTMVPACFHHLESECEPGGVMHLYEDTAMVKDAYLD